MLVNFSPVCVKDFRFLKGVPYTTFYRSKGWKYTYQAGPWALCMWLEKSHTGEALGWEVEVYYGMGHADAERLSRFRLASTVAKHFQACKCAHWRGGFYGYTLAELFASNSFQVKVGPYWASTCTQVWEDFSSC
jgi:hypothetical protein